MFQGCVFPAEDPYRFELQEMGLEVAGWLGDRGVQGRFGVDFVSIPRGDRWEHYTIEINLRKGGTTHPFMMLLYLTDGSFEPSTGLYQTPTRPRTISTARATRA